MNIKLSIAFLTLFFSQILNAQYAENLDSLELNLKSIQAKRILSKEKNSVTLDTAEAFVNYLLSKMYWGDNPNKVREYALKCLSLSAKHYHTEGMGDAYNSLGVLYFYKGDYKKSKKYYELAEEMFLKSGNKIGIGNAINNIGNIYFYQGDFPRAQENYLESLKFLKQGGDKSSIAPTLSNIGIIYDIQKKYPEAIKMYKEAIKLRDTLFDKEGIAGDYNNIGLAYSIQGNRKDALLMHQKALEINKQVKNMYGLASNYANIGEIYVELKNYKLGLEYGLIALKISEEIETDEITSSCCDVIGQAYLGLSEIKKAEIYLTRSAKLAKKLQNWEGIAASHERLSELETAKGNCTNAFKYYKIFIEAKDTMFNEENTTEMVQAKMQYDFDNKELINKAEQEKKDLIAKKEIQKQKFIRNGLLTGFGLVLIFAGIFFNQRNKIRKGKKISDELLLSVSRQKTEVEKQKNIVEYQNKEILSSIEYAKRIQATILPPLKVVEKHLEDSFVLYLPKDIVAGDFYWMENIEQEEGLVLIAACDCTGHGVPGAMVSVVCSNALNRAVKESNITEPGLILDKVAELVVSDFSKDENENVQDGMDTSLCALNTKTGKIQWAGANNPLFIISDGKLTEIKGDKQPIGKIDNLRPFKTNLIDTKKGDTFYLITDGYSDQFGGPENRKLTKKKFKELLLSIQHLSMDEQRNHLYEFHNSYKKDAEQIDDILVIGIRV